MPPYGAYGLLNPLPADSYRTSSGYGPRTHPVTGEKGKHHNGLDLAAPTGTPVYAAAAGYVKKVYANHSINGNAVILSHDSEPGVSGTGYLHLSRVDVGQGDAVRAGQKIGEVGSTGRSTGPHLHFIVYNEAGKDIDPAGLLSRAAAVVAPVARTSFRISLGVYLGSAVLLLLGALALRFTRKRAARRARAAEEAAYYGAG